MKTYIIKFFIFLLLLCFVKEGKPDIINDVRKVTTEMAALTGPVMDMAECFRNISKRASAFVKLLGPISSLAAAGMEIFIDPKSPEMEAIKELHQAVVNGFASFEQTIEQNAHEERLFNFMFEYEMVVTQSIKTIDFFYKKVTDPAEDRGIWKEEFVRECSMGCKKPRDALHFLDNVLNNHRPIPTERSAVNHIKAAELFDRIDAQREELLNDMDMFLYDYREKKSLFFERVSQLNETAASEMLLTIERAFDEPNISVSDMYRELSFTLDNTGPPSKWCLLDILADAQRWKRGMNVDALDTFRKDIFRLSMIHTACINISTHGNPRKVLALFQELEEIFVGIGQKVGDWLTAKLRVTWPSITAKYAKESLKSDVPEHESNYNDTARDLLKVADALGPANIVHQIVVFPSYYTNVTWMWHAPQCDNSTCMLIGDHRKINIVIYRYESGRYDQATAASVYMNTTFSQIYDALSEEWSRTSNLQELYAALTRRVANLTAPDLFRHNLLLHNQNMDYSHSEIHTGHAYIPVPGVMPFDKVNITTNSAAWGYDQYKLCFIF